MKTAIVVAQAGHIIPDADLTKIFHELAPACLGIAVVGEDDKGPTLLVEHWPDLKELGDWDAIRTKINEVQEELKEFQTVLTFSDTAGLVVTNGENELETNQMPPFILLSDDDGRINLIGAMAGDYSAYAKEGTPAHFTTMTEEVLPYLQQTFRLCGGDMTKVMGELRSPLFIKNMNKLSTGDTGIISFLASNGDLLTIQKKDDLIKTNDWGWSSHIGDTAAPSSTVSKLASGLKGKFGGLNKKPVASTEPVKAPVVEPPKVDPPKKVEDPKPDTALPLSAGKAKVKCPFAQGTKNEKRDWYKKNAGFVPENYKACPEVEVNFPIKDLTQLKAAVETKTPAVAEVPKTEAKVELKKTVVSPKATATLPIIPAEIKEELLRDSTILKSIDKSSQQVDLVLITEIEKKHPSFFEQTGMNIEDLFYCNFDQLKQFRAKYPEAADVLILSLLSALARSYQTQGKETPATKPEATPATVAGNVQPEKKLRFGGRR